MVKRKIVSFILFSLPALLLWAEGGKSQIELADPYILLDGGKYYAYGTRDDNGIRCYSSDDLRSWKYEGLALHKDNTTESIFFWAPEVYHLGDKYYMYYSANQRLFVATGNSPKGPFKQVGGYQMQNLLGDENCIDSHVFFDDDGSVWMFFVRFNDNICIWQCRLADDYITPVEGTLRKCIAGSQAWEQKEGRVNEGPNVIKYKNTYYLTYSGNGYESQNYAVGYATTRNISKGAWTKYENNPILCRRDELVGTGHHSIFTDKEGNTRIVFHAHNSTESVHHRLMYIGTMQFSGTRLTMSNDPIIRPTLTDNPYNPELIDKARAFQQGAATTVDLNNDGYQDIVVGGMNEGKRLTYVSKYLSATHRWSTNTSIPFQVANMPSLIPCDLNNDGNMDIVAFEQNGSDADDNSRQGIFLGKGDGTFTEAPLVFTNPDGSLCPFDVKGPCSADIIDIDNDGRKDYYVNGFCSDDNYLTDVQRGIASVMCYNLYPTPKRPEAPLNPTATVQDGVILLQWEVPESVQPNCTYEIFITDSLGNQLNSTPAFVGGTNDGVRKINRMGRIGSAKQWTFHPTASGTYFWGVQTVNAAYNGSTFTTGPAFTVSSVPTGIHSYAGLDIAQPSGIYSPEGIRRTEPQRGINILRTKEGIRKVVISN